MAKSVKGDSKTIPVTTAEEVRRIAGPLNDAAVAAILRIEPSLEELETAAAYALGEGDRADRAGHPLSGRVAQIFDILGADEADDEERAAPH